MHLETKALTKSYGKIKALDDVSISFDSGIYGILGANGAGKSTLINLLIDNLRPDSGEVICDGQNIAALGADYRSRLGYVPQQNTLYDAYTAERFLWYIASLKGLSRRQAKVKVDEVLEIVNLKDFARQKLGGFSGGMKRRVMIAQALLNDPELLIMDEPTAGLDPKERIEIRNFISRISFKKTVLLATHIVQDIEVIAREVVLMKKGQILCKKEPNEVIREIAGHVFEATVEVDELDSLQQRYKLGNIIKTDDRVLVRLVADEAPCIHGVQQATHPMLEDVYLYYLEEREARHGENIHKRTS